MQVRDVIAIARKRAGLKVEHSNQEDEMLDLAAMAEGMSTIIREIQPGVDRRTMTLNGNEPEIHLPYPLLTVENLILDGRDLSNYRVASSQMQTNVESQNV